jgi:hypothetical protein
MDENLNKTLKIINYCRNLINDFIFNIEMDDNDNYIIDNLKKIKKNLYKLNKKKLKKYFLRIYFYCEEIENELGYINCYEYIFYLDDLKGKIKELEK